MEITNFSNHTYRLHYRKLKQTAIYCTSIYCVYSIPIASFPDSREPGSVRFRYDTFSITGRLKVSYGNRTLPSSRESGDKAIYAHVWGHLKLTNSEGQKFLAGIFCRGHIKLCGHQQILLSLYLSDRPFTTD